MRTTIPTNRRSTVQQTPRGVRIIIPARRDISVLVIYGIWLLGWVFGEFVAVTQLILGNVPQDLFMTVWLSGWTVGGAVAGSIWLWTAFGRTVLEIDHALLTIRREALRTGVTHAYDLRQISDIRAQYVARPWLGRRMLHGVLGGPVVFDYGAKAVKLGAGLDEAEAKLVVADLQAAIT